MRIIFCGDTHGRFIAIENLINRKNPDLVIQTGDFGIWPNEHGTYEHIKINSNVPVYFCRGNHENHDILDTYPDFQISNLKTGERIIKDEILSESNHPSIEVLQECQSIQFPNADNIYLCESGSILEKDGLRILFIGGAESVDKSYRIQGKSWWPQEKMWNYQIDHLLNILEEPLDINIIVSHTAPEMVLNKFYSFINKDKISQLLDVIYEKVRPELWFFGHLHERILFETERTKFVGLNMCDFDRNGKYKNDFFAQIDL